MQSAVDGTLNVVRQAAAAGVKQIVVTASLAALKSPTTDFYSGEIITPNGTRIRCTFIASFCVC